MINDEKNAQIAARRLVEPAIKRWMLGTEISARDEEPLRKRASLPLHSILD